MKKFDISELTVKRLCGIFVSTLPLGSEAEAVASHSLLLIKARGESIYEGHGKKYTADSEHIVFIPKGASYSLYVKKSGACTVIELEADGELPDAPIEYYIGDSKEIRATVKNLSHYWRLHGPAFRSKCLSELYSLLTEIANIQSFSDSLAGKYGLIHRSVKYIEANYDRQDLYTPMLADMSGIGETYYRAIFIAVFGVAPTKYIQQYRVEKAKELLVNSTGSIEDIAVSVGFANSSYFCKVFKSISGLTPSEFAEKGRLIG